MIFALILGTSVPSSQQWPTYDNVRYGYSICYSPTLIRAREAENSDGLTFTSSTGGQLSVWGENALPGETLATVTAEQAKTKSGARAKVTYRVNRPKWRVISGIADQTMFYAKVMQRGDQFVVFRASYPARRAKAVSPTVAAMSRCLRLGTPSF